MLDFENIYNQYFLDIYKFIYSLSKDATVAEEITQETFFKALKSIDSFNGSCKINVWLCQIAKNTYFSNYNKQSRFNTINSNEILSSISVENMLLNKEYKLDIHKALHTLEEPYKEVFTLRVFGELPFNDISQIFGKTESWARVTFYRGKIKLQDKIKEI